MANDCLNNLKETYYDFDEVFKNHLDNNFLFLEAYKTYITKFEDYSFNLLKDIATLLNIANRNYREILNISYSRGKYEKDIEILIKELENQDNANKKSSDDMIGNVKDYNNTPKRKNDEKESIEEELLDMAIEDKDDGNNKTK